uniref:Receptor ligand binding region domain-containing protein n=1 Tax=Tetranychus urticae TaxID=32264 RepID=T1KEK0_TETUR
MDIMNCCYCINELRHFQQLFRSLITAVRSDLKWTSRNVVQNKLLYQKISSYMPFIHPGYPETNSQNIPNFGLNIRPEYLKAIVEVIKLYRWKDIIYIYDSDEGKEGKTGLLQVIKLSVNCDNNQILLLKQETETCLFTLDNGNIIRVIRARKKIKFPKS